MTTPDVSPVTRAPATPRAYRGRGRRLVAAAVVAPVLLVVLTDAGGGWALSSAPLWTALVGVAALLGAATLASYLPLEGQGWRDALGCSPCAAVSAVSVLGAAFLLASSPHQASMALVAAGATAFGLFQRLRGAGTSCPTP